MCQENYTTKNKKYKRIKESEHGIIQECLNNNKKTGEIAIKLEKDSSTIKKIITRYSTKRCANPKCTQCLNYRSCKEKNLCDIGRDRGYCTSKCKECGISPNKCEKYNPKIECKHLKGHRKVCNGCKNYKQCRKPKLIYNAEEAIKIQKIGMSNSRRKKEIEKIELDKREIYDGYVSALIEKGISVGVVLATMKSEIKEILDVSVPTLYGYIDSSELGCKNIDLANKVKRKEKKESPRGKGKSKHRENGRSVHDLTEIEKESDSLGEFDLVEGAKSGDVLLTVINNKSKFMLGIPLGQKTQENVVGAFDMLEKELTSEVFKELFGITKTDNGSEFLNFDALEKSIEVDSKRMEVHYADAYCSWQKALVENNHRIIRYILEKGYDFSNLSKEEIFDIMNRVNNYPRKSLNFSTPYLEVTKRVDKQILAKLGFYYIPVEELDMKRKKVAA